jgi:hypothetical protein
MQCVCRTLAICPVILGTVIAFTTDTRLNPFPPLHAVLMLFQGSMSELMVAFGACSLCPLMICMAALGRHVQ